MRKKTTKKEVANKDAKNTIKNEDTYATLNVDENVVKIANNDEKIIFDGNSTIDDSIKLSDLSLFDLNTLLNMTIVICGKYEQMSKMNIGSYDEITKKEIISATKLLLFYQKKYNLIIDEIEKRINKIL